MSNFIKRKQLVEEFHNFDVTTTYDEFLLFKGSAICGETDEDLKQRKSRDGNNKLIQGAFEICSQNGLKKTHSKAVIMTKEHETVEKPLRAFEFIRRKTKA